MTTIKIRELKRTARQLLLGNYTILALVTFLLACNFFLSSVSLLAVPPIGGWIIVYLTLLRCLSQTWSTHCCLPECIFTTGSRSRSRSGSLRSSPFGTIGTSRRIFCSPGRGNMVSLNLLPWLYAVRKKPSVSLLSPSCCSSS